MTRVTIYTDGACLGNPGPGGYAAVLIQGKHRKELSGGFRRTTNNRMEIMAALVGLQTLNRKCEVTLYTDSKYLQQSISLGWAKRWQAKGWMKGPDKRVSWDLWEKLLGVCGRHEIEFVWLRGHAGDTENERCDFLSTQAARQQNLPPDLCYEQLTSLPSPVLPTLLDLRKNL